MNAKATAAARKYNEEMFQVAREAGEDTFEANETAEIMTRREFGMEPGEYAEGDSLGLDLTPATAVVVTR